MKNEVKKFEVGKTYCVRNGSFLPATKFTVVKRTAKMIFVESEDKISVTNTRYKINEGKTSEFVKLGFCAGAQFVYACNEYDENQVAYDAQAAKNLRMVVEAINGVDASKNAQSAEKTIDEEINAAAVVEETHEEETPKAEVLVAVNTITMEALNQAYEAVFELNRFSEDTCSTLNAEDDTAALQAQLENAQAEIEACQQDIKEDSRLKEYYCRMYIETIATLAKIEDEITRHGLYLAEDKGRLAEAKAYEAAVQAQIDSRNFSAEKLIDAVEAASDDSDVDAVTFEMQHFTDAGGEIREIESVEDSDTKTIDAFTTLASEESDVDEGDAYDEATQFDLTTRNLVETIGYYESEIRRIRNKLRELENELEDATAELDEHEEKLSKYVSGEVPLVIAFRAAESWKRNQTNITGQGSARSFHWTASDIASGNVRFLIDECDGSVGIDYYSEDCRNMIARYQSVKDFKAAVMGLAAAVQRGDTHYQFPEDTEAK